MNRREPEVYRKLISGETVTYPVMIGDKLVPVIDKRLQGMTFLDEQEMLDYVANGYSHWPNNAKPRAEKVPWFDSRTCGALSGIALVIGTIIAIGFLLPE